MNGLLAVALAGCSSGNSLGELVVDPGRYAAYHCDDLAAQWKTLLKREKELHGLMDKADEGGTGGEVIGSLAYRTDYEAVLTQEKLVQRTAAEKKCELSPAAAESDRSVH